MRTHLTVTGNLTYDPSSRRTKDGIHVVEFGLAHNNRRLDRTTGLWEDGETTFYAVTCWRRLADGVRSSLHKGDPVVVHGWFTTRDYERNDGQVRSELKIEAQAVGPDLARSFAAVNRGPRTGPVGTGAPPSDPLASADPAPAPDPEEDEETDHPSSSEGDLMDAAPAGNR